MSPLNFSKIYSSSQPIWKEENTFAFNELLLSWNGVRPKKGNWMFWVSLQEGEWLQYAEWGANGQRSFKSTGLFAESYQDVVRAKCLCNQFQIKVEGEELSQLHSLCVCLSNLANYTPVIPKNLPSVLLQKVPRQSQMVLPHPRYKDLCSPTSTTTAISYLSGKKIDPLSFASCSRDETFDIYGNWVLNVAEAYNQTKLPCHVERLADFSTLHAKLMQGKPVVVSVKGDLPGAPKPYPFGHLLCVIGFGEGKVYCMDPASPDNESTFIGYELTDFLKAWGVRYNLAYVFS